MAIIATNKGTPRELIPSGNYVARCYQMIHIGQVMEVIKGKSKVMDKIRIGWELPTELKIFKEEIGEQPLIISNEYTLSLNEKSNLRKMLASWRGQDFTNEEAEKFDVTKLIGASCMLNIIQKPSTLDATKIYNSIGSVSPIPKGLKCPPQITPTECLDYETFNEELFNSLPDFIKDKVKTSIEYAAMKNPDKKNLDQHNDKFIVDDPDDLPF